MTLGIAVALQSGLTAAQSSYVTGSVIATAGKKYILFVVSSETQALGGALQPTSVSGFASSWTNEGTVVATDLSPGQIRATMYTGIGPFTTGAITIGFAANQNAVVWHVLEFTDAGTALQIKQRLSISALSISVAMDPTSTGTELLFIRAQNSGSATHDGSGDGMTILGIQQNFGSSGGVQRSSIWHKTGPDADNSLTITSTSSSVSVGFGVEYPQAVAAEIAVTKSIAVTIGP